MKITRVFDFADEQLQNKSQNQCFNYKKMIIGYLFQQKSI